MENPVPATEARIHFGEIMRKAVDSGEHIVVEKGGTPQIVILSITEYRRLTARATGEGNWRKLVIQAGERLATEAGDRPIPAPEDVIRKMRALRTDELLDLN